MVQYADDFVLLSENRAWLKEKIPPMRAFLREKLKLELHPEKVFIKTLASGVDFLGWVHFPSHRVLRTITKKRMLKRIRTHFKNTSSLRSRQFSQDTRRDEEIVALRYSSEKQRSSLGKLPEPFGIWPISAIPASAPPQSTHGVHFRRRSLFSQKLAHIAGRGIFEMDSENPKAETINSYLRLLSHGNTQKIKSHIKENYFSGGM